MVKATRKALRIAANLHQELVRLKARSGNDLEEMADAAVASFLSMTPAATDNMDPVKSMLEELGAQLSRMSSVYPKMPIFVDQRTYKRYSRMNSRVGDHVEMLLDAIATSFEDHCEIDNLSLGSIEIVIRNKTSSFNSQRQLLLFEE